jgi:hypothetical protein
MWAESHVTSFEILWNNIALTRLTVCYYPHERKALNVVGNLNMTFLKSLFSKKTLPDNSKETLSSEFARHVQKAIELLGCHSGSLSDEEVVQLLTDNCISYNEAIEILLFLPIAFVRHWLPNVKWHDTYFEFISDKIQMEKIYCESKSFQIIWEVTKDYFENSRNSDTVIKVGGRSAELHSINQLLNNCSKFENIELSKTVIIR